jgi:FkbM family methyltransferase
VCSNILAGETYPQLPIDAEFATVLDVGANCGAASVYFARCYPDAIVHAVEPARAAFALLEGNTAQYSNIRIHHLGLHAADQVVPLFHGSIDSVTASVHKRDTKNTDMSEMVQLRDARAWVAEQGITAIDLLKLDVEGCEVEVLERLGDLLESVKVVYVEYDSTAARRRIEQLLDASHELCHGFMSLEQGELIYVSRRVLDADSSARHAIVEFFNRRMQTAAAMMRAGREQRASSAGGTG